MEQSIESYTHQNFISNNNNAPRMTQLIGQNIQASKDNYVNSFVWNMKMILLRS